MLPDGARDSLPMESEELQSIEMALRGTLGAYGYREVATPVLELAQVLEEAVDEDLGDVFRLFDQSGRVLVLRPDITVPISRLVATRMRDHPGPIRVFYFGRAFRPPPAGAPKAAEVRQAGAELVGVSGPAGEAEMIAMLHRSLTSAGIGELTIAVGDISLTSAVLDGAGVDRDTRTRLGRALTAKDLVLWQEIVDGLEMSEPLRRVVHEIPTLRGDVALLDHIRDAVPSATPACARVGELLGLLDQYGIADDVMLDVGIARDWPYYSGLVLEAHSPTVGMALAVGGRYDRLAERFGTPRPSVGFAVDLDVVNRALTMQGANGSARGVGLVLVGGLGAYVVEAELLRSRGVPVVAIARDHGDPIGFAAAEGWRFVATAEGDRFTVTDRTDGSERTVDSLEEVSSWIR